MQSRLDIGRVVIYQIILLTFAHLPTWLLFLFTGMLPWKASGVIDRKVLAMYVIFQALLLIGCAIHAISLWSERLFLRNKEEVSDNTIQAMSVKMGPGPTPKP